MPNPFDLFGSTMNAMLAWLANSWMASGANALLTAIDQLTTAQFPEINQNWFLVLWNSIFGLSLMVCLIAIVLHALIFMVKPNHPTMGAAIVGFLKLIFNGLFLLVFLVMAIWIADYLVKLMNMWFQSILGPVQVSDIYNTAIDMTTLDIWLRLGLAYLGMQMGNSLQLNTTMMNAWVLLFVLWYLFSSAFGVSRAAQFARSFFLAATLAVIFARDFQVFHLGLSAIFLDKADDLGMPVVGQYLSVLFAGFVALLIPLILALAFLVPAYKLERRLDVKMFIKRQMGNVSDSANANELTTEKVGAITRTKEGTKDAASGLVRWASIAAATAAFAKIGTAAAAKITGGAPTPQTKAAALGLMATTAGLGMLEKKTRSFVESRTSRPGASSTHQWLDDKHQNYKQMRPERASKVSQQDQEQQPVTA